MNTQRNIVLDCVRVIGMVFVMFIHSPLDGDVKASPEVFLLKSFIAAGAVPVFFLLSGYLGAKKIDAPSTNLKQFAKDKYTTLIIPYFFWNILVLILAFVCKFSGIASQIRGNGAYFDVNLTLPSIVAALLGIGRAPIVYQFWFLRDLIVVIFLAFFICKYIPKIPLLPWLLFFIPLPIFPSLGFYLLGHQMFSVLPIKNFPSQRSSIIYCVIWLLMGVAVMTDLLVIVDPFASLGSAAFIFMLAIVLSTARFAGRAAVLGPAVFFVYATHEPLQTILGRIWMGLQLPGYGTLFCFLAIPACVFPFCVFAHSILDRVFPRLSKVATGGR